MLRKKDVEGLSYGFEVVVFSFYYLINPSNILQCGLIVVDLRRDNYIIQ